MYKIVDNFLDKENFSKLQEFVLSPNLDWYFNSTVNTLQKKDNTSYFTHHLYTRQHTYTHSNYYNNFKVIEEKLNVKAMIRMKINCYPHTAELITHAPHRDYDFEHKGCILSFNTCNGGTVMEDGTFVQSIANRALLFDPSEPHCSTTCTDNKARINININYF